MSDTAYLPAILLRIPHNLVTALGLPLALGMLGGSMTRKVVQGPWYQNLKTPPGRPPRQVFPIVWPILFLSMGYASHLAAKAMDVAAAPGSRSNLALGFRLYYIQLSLNVLWSPLFFGAKQTGLALVDNVLLTITTYYLTNVWSISTDSATTPFLLPYCAWLTFATYLNAGIWWLNRGQPSSQKGD